MLEAWKDQWLIKLWLYVKCIAADGLKWHEWKALAHIDAGHLRQSAESS